MSKKFFGQIGRIKPECIETYCRLHEVDIYTEQWAGIRQLIADCNIRNYSIYIEDDVVFGYYEYVGDDYDDGGGDSHVRIKGMDYIYIDDYTTTPARLQFLLD